MLIALVAAAQAIFLNPCPDGCVVAPGTTDARTDHSDLVRKTSALSPWRYGTTAWSQVTSCVRSALAPFDVAVTDVDPGTADHLEVMVAGAPAELGQATDVGGIADVSCTSIGDCRVFEPDALAFVFADYWAGNANEICGSILQQLGHTWALDHVLDATDPMSVARLGVTAIPAFHDHEMCGGDCSAGISQFGLPCVGTGAAATHTCIGTGADTQDEVQMLLGVLGPSAYIAPSLAIQSPAGGAAPQGFSIELACTSNDGSAVAELDVAIDGVPLAGLTAPPLDPAVTHVVTATCSTAHSSAAVSRTLEVGAACASDGDCDRGEVCDGGACIAGPSLAGGLGTSCKTASDCRSDLCVSEGYGHMYCVSACEVGAASCPTGFSCLAAGPDSGLCWAVDVGGCASSRTPGLAPLAFAAAVARSRRRRLNRNAPRSSRGA